MPLTALDAHSALIVIDLQSGTAGAPTAHPIDGILEHVNAMVAAFRQRGLPIVLANVDGIPAGRTQYGEGARSFPAPFSDLLEGLDHQPGDLTVTRSTWSAFAGTDLHQRLQELGVSQLVLTGVATSFGVESTARQAYDLGYSVAIAEDAITDRSADAHRDSITRVFPALGQVGAASEILGLLPPVCFSSSRAMRSDRTTRPRPH